MNKLMTRKCNPEYYLNRSEGVKAAIAYLAQKQEGYGVKEYYTDRATYDRLENIEMRVKIKYGAYND